MKYRYWVVVNHPDHKDDVHTELTSPTLGGETIPDRVVECLNSHPGSEYNGEFMLTEEEAELLKTDYRIVDVHRDPIEMGYLPKHFTVQQGNFSKDATGQVYGELNWGLARATATSEPFGTNTTITNFNYNLDGNGVDIVFLDTGIYKYHPEFAVNADGTGGSRVIDIDWSSYGIIPSNGTGSWVGDYDGHGTNVASIAAGITNGWAKKANIYMLNVLDFTNLPNTYTDPVSALQTVRAFHNAKPRNQYGWKRPTVCSNSWGFVGSYANMTATNYRGTVFPTTQPNSQYGQVPPYGGTPDQASFSVRVASVDAEVLSGQNAGIIFVGAAGNDSLKIDVPSGADYNNYIISRTGVRSYYHQGASPTAATNVICVGATSNATPEHKISFSDTGPRVDIFAPGNLIMGAYSSSTYIFNAVTDPRSGVSTSTSATFYWSKISGTSQATPQVAGVVACMLEARPFYNQIMTNNWLKSVATVGLLNETYYGPTTSTVYLNYASLQGATNALLFQPFNNPYPTTITSS